MEYKLKEVVYHENVYGYKEPLTVVGIREKELELEGDYSGGTNNVTQREWQPISGVSRIYDYQYIKNCRTKAISLKAKGVYTGETCEDLIEIILELTKDVK